MAADLPFVVTGFAEDVRPHMADSSFFVCPIRDGGGTKLKILNAMAMETVVIADPVALEGIDVEPGTNVIVARSPDEYTRAVRTLLSDPAAYRRMAAAARQLVATRYAYEIIGQELEQKYRSVHAAHPKRGH